MIKVFEKLEQYNIYTNNGTELDSGTIYYVEEDDSTHFITNNIDGVTTIYDKGDIPSGNVEITENGENINVKSYATATVNVPQPSGKTTITQNGTDIDIAQYATADVNVPQPSGTISITENGTNIDVASYASADVAVPQPSGKTTITQNGTDIDIAQYAKADVAVPQPSGNVELTENGTGIDIAQYATATVNVSSGGGQAEQDLIDLIEGDTVTLNIPNGTTKIKENIFSRNTSLTSVTIPNSVTSIGNYAFQGCTGLTSVTIPSSVTSIGNYAFQGCTNIGTTENYVKYIDGWAVELTETNRSSYTIKEGTKSIINGLFYSNSSVSTISLPSTIMSIPEFFGAQCNGLSTINIPNSVTSIGESAFQNSGLTSVIIPSSVTSIGRNAFYYCRILTSVTVEATTPPTLGANAFTSNAVSGRKIYVPAESVEAYKAATNWMNYAEDIEPIP